MKNKFTPEQKRQHAMKKPEKIVEEQTEEKAETLQENPKKPQYDYEDINSAPRNGSLIMVSATGEDAGEAVLWRKTKAFANATHRWEETGFFISNRSGQQVSFIPKYWRARRMYEV